MLKISLTAAFILCAVPATAHSPRILASHAPTYKAGEHFIGYLQELGRGIPLKLVQYALPLKNGKTVVAMDFVHADGRVLVREIRDPVTGRRTLSNGKSTLIVRKTTCTARKFFPLYVGKHFDCSSIMSEDGQLTMHSYRYSYIYTKRDRRGRITSLCGTRREAGAKKILDICTTPDDKWIQSVTELPSLTI